MSQFSSSTHSGVRTGLAVAALSVWPPLVLTALAGAEYNPAWPQLPSYPAAPILLSQAGRPDILDCEMVRVANPDGERSHPVFALRGSYQQRWLPVGHQIGDAREGTERRLGWLSSQIAT